MLLTNKDLERNSKDSEINRYYKGSNQKQLVKGNADYILSIIPSRSKRKLKRYNSSLKDTKLRQGRLYTFIKKAYLNSYGNSTSKIVKTHTRNSIILPGFIKKNILVHNGRTFNKIDIKISMIGRYLGEYSLSYKPVKHGKPGIGASHSSRFIPLR